MKISIPVSELETLLCKQIDNIFTLKSEDLILINLILPQVLKRCEYCFSFSKNKYYSRDENVYFHPFHSGQYSIFLYYFSNEAWKRGNSLIADKVYYLNKTLNGCDMFYEIELPKIFSLDHPVGSVLGRAKYSDFFSFGQNCTVGNNKGIFPKIGRNVNLCANSMILGNCNIGDNVTLAANSCVKDEDVPSNTIEFGSSPRLIFKDKR